MEVFGHFSLGFDVVVDAKHLLGREADGLGDFLGRDVVVFAVEAQVHLVVGQGEKNSSCDWAKE